MPLSINAYAKINLTLDITGRRSDGYHTLDSVMQSISLHDVISIESTQNKAISVSCDEKAIQSGKDNIVYKAAELFFIYSGIKSEGVSFDIKKHIPFESGLGGGSADAAAALKLLNCFCCTGFSTEQLCAVGARVGADVPFCIRCGTAFAQGIGERIAQVSPLPNCLILVCKPDFGISTAQAYDEADRKGFGTKKYSDGMAEALNSGRLLQVASCLGNCFEDILGLKEISEIKSEIILSGALGACMTGSGSAVFGLFENSEKAEQCKNKLLKRYRYVFLCKPVRA